MEQEESKRICANCRQSEELYPDPECPYIWCKEYQEVIPKYSKQDCWEEKDNV